MFRPIAPIFRSITNMLKENFIYIYIYICVCVCVCVCVPILRGDVEISSSLRVTVSLFSGISNGQ